MNKILFLDIDGVLNNKHYYRANPRGSEIDPANIENLKLILSSTDCNVVISSSWKLSKSLDELKNIFKGFGVDANRIIDVTPNLKSRAFAQNVSPTRACEIEAWVQANDVDCCFCIVDDDQDLGHLRNVLFKTSFYDGLTHKLACGIIAFFESK